MPNTVLANRVGMDTTTTGTGTITLGSAISGYQTFAGGGIVDADVVPYLIIDGSNWEVGTGTYTATGTTLTRVVEESTNSDSAISLSGTAQVYITARKENLVPTYVGGTFTPTVDGTTTAGVGTYSTQSGNYLRIGSVVLFNIRLIWTAHTGTGNMILAGLPVTPAGSFEVVYFRHSNLTLPAGTVLQGFVNGTNTNIVLKSVATGGGADADLALDTSATIHCSGYYGTTAA